MIKENETIELRKSLTLLKEGIISLSAMLNKSNKGDVYFGIDDDGKVLGAINSCKIWAVTGTIFA